MGDLREDKRRVLEVAEMIFGRAGFDGASLEDVARAAKVDRAAMTRLCFSKEDLFFQVLVHNLEDVLAESEKSLKPELEVLELLRVVSEHAYAVVQGRPLVRMLLLGQLESKLPNWRDRLHELRQRCASIPEQALTLGIESGALRPDLAVEIVAQILLELHAMAYVFAQRYGAHGAEMAAKRREVAIPIILQGLLHPEAPPSVVAQLAVKMPAPGPTPKPGPAPVPAHSADPKTRLLDTAVQLGIDFGVKAITIAKAAHVGSVIYDEAMEFFESDDDLALAAMEREVDAAVAEVATAMSKAPSPLAAVREGAERAFSAVQGHMLVAQIVNGAAAAAFPGSLQKISALGSKMAQVPLPSLQAAAKAKLIRDDLPLEQVAALMFEMQIAGHLLHHQEGPDMQLRAMQRRVAGLDLLMRGVLKR